MAARNGDLARAVRAPSGADPSMSLPVSRVHVTELRVRYAETDQMGVVYHANYLAWCEVGRTEFIRTGGMSYRQMEETGVALAVADASIRFHAPARYDDVVRVETTLTDVRSRSVTFAYLISRVDDGARLVSASTMLVSLGRGSRPMAMPPQVRDILERARA